MNALVRDYAREVDTEGLQTHDQDAHEVVVARIPDESVVPDRQRDLSFFVVMSAAVTVVWAPRRHTNRTPVLVGALRHVVSLSLWPRARVL